MSLQRQRRRLVSWVALLALVLAALAPTVSRAVAWQSSESLPFAVVCSADPASRTTGLTAETSPGAQHHGSVFEHCPFCSIHAPGIALPTAEVSSLPPPGLGDALPERFLRAPRTLHAWVSAQPRAPPLSC